MIGGKIAPRPPLFSRCSTIQVVAFASARRRNGFQGNLSTTFSNLSSVPKNSRQCFGTGTLLGNGRPGVFVCNSAIDHSSGTSHVGWNAQMIESGTTMQRDQYDIL